ncbi:MAG: hypothetical protein JWP00_1492 [Chloroflexi bacterium]|nr:hypothetical protein [Chloroflexota bacterium]
MISIEDRKRFANAEAKARRIRPVVRVTEFGTYKVASSDPAKAPYTVKFSKDRAGHWQAECNCQGHSREMACYHIPAAYASHKIQVGIRQQVRAAEGAAPAPAPHLYVIPTTVEEARAQAEAALANLGTYNWQVDMRAEMEPVSMDRECPKCGLVQPDDDSTDCCVCSAILNPDDEDPDPDHDPALCACGKPGFSFFSGRWHCWPCTQQAAETEAEKDAARKLVDEEPDEAFDLLHEELFGFTPARRERVKEAW